MCFPDFKKKKQLSQSETDLDKILANSLFQLFNIIHGCHHTQSEAFWGLPANHWNPCNSPPQRARSLSETGVVSLESLENQRRTWTTLRMPLCGSNISDVFFKNDPNNCRHNQFSSYSLVIQIQISTFHKIFIHGSMFGEICGQTPIWTSPIFWGEPVSLNEVHPFSLILCRTSQGFRSRVFSWGDVEPQKSTATHGTRV